MLGAWLGQDQLYMVVELLSTDLWKALADPDMQEDLQWYSRHDPAWCMADGQVSAGQQHSAVELH